MPRGPAIGVLAAFGLGALAVGYWGFSDIQNAHQAILDCAPAVPLDTSSLWFIGCTAIALLPMLALVPDRLHSALFALMMAAFFLLPGLAHGWLTTTAVENGYTDIPPLFTLQSATLTSTAECQSQPTAVALLNDLDVPDNRRAVPRALQQPDL